jgi:fido (protein-threonine AMPylation protein)
VQRSQKVAAILESSPEAEQLDLILDSRPLHRELFHGLAPEAFADSAGTWRGTAGTSIHNAPRAVFLARRMPGLRARDMCTPAADVAAAMEVLASQLRQLWDERPGIEDPWRDEAYAALAAVTARFFAIHPYMDGNGHIWRLCLPVLGKRLGLTMRDGWSIDRRPYGPEFSLAIQWYRDHPTILADQLRRWMATSGLTCPPVVLRS